jgi:hypothetical protein
MKKYGMFRAVVLGGVLLCSSGCGWLGSAAQVVSNEVDPANLQRKYEWFKDTSAQLDKKKADIAVYERRFKTVGGATGTCPQTLNRTASEQCFVWVQEVSGIIASYNGLAAEYNSEMAKWNWRFTNVGMLPQGASESLPREFKPYEY